MSANAAPAPVIEGGFPDYPGFGSPEDVDARILLSWIWEQLGSGGVKAEVGDYVLATEGRIVGVGPDLNELDHQLMATEPELRNARVVVYRVSPTEY
jgi:hypothetical protein